MRSLPLAAAVLIALAAAPWARAHPPGPAGAHDDRPHTHAPAAPAAGPDVPAGVLRFEILGDEGVPIPGRLTFITPGGAEPDLFPGVDADPADLAIRKNVIYTLSGRGAVTVPAGQYVVYASRGLEYSIASRPVTIAEGGEVFWTPALRRELDTRGWISGDFHLHTLTYSGHGDSNLNERIISLAGEGVEFAVATDHNHNTDYNPTIESLGAGRHLTGITGNEVSTPIGHFNAFPLDPARNPPEHRLRDATALFKLLRDETSAFGIVPVIQVNHPRWGDIDYFGQAGLDPVTGAPAHELYSDDFDTVEIFNENEGWGYFDPEETDLPIGEGSFSVLRDWFHLLNRGHRAAAVGNSDSHTVHYDMAGYPRNFVVSPTDDPAQIDPRDVAAALRAHRVFTTCGPFVEFTAAGAPMGSLVRASEGQVEVRVRVSAASWIDVDVIRVFVNGDEAARMSVSELTSPIRADARILLPLDRDAWIAVCVEGDRPLAPIVGRQTRDILPLAVCNPVWIDADGDGQWTPPAQQARELISAGGSVASIRQRTAHWGPTERGLVVLAAAASKSPLARELAEEALADEARHLRLAGARAAEQIASPDLRPALARAWDRDDLSPYTRVAVLRAMLASGEPAGPERLMHLVRVSDSPLTGRYLMEVQNQIQTGAFVTDWLVAGLFPSPARDHFLNSRLPAEDEPSRDATFEGRDGPVAWRPMRALPNGLVNLRLLTRTPGDTDRAIAVAQTWLHAPDDREILFAFGSDDGALVEVNGRRVYGEAADRGAQPFQHIGAMPLRAGWNRVVIKVENGGGDFGFYFRPLDDAVTASSKPNP